MSWLFIFFIDHSLFYLGDPFDLGLQEYDRSKTITKYIKALSSDILDFTIFCNAALWLPFLLLFGLRAVKRQLSTKRNVSMISLNQTSKRSPCICEFLEEKVCTELALVIPLFSGGSCYRLQRSLITRFSWLTKWFFSCSLVGKIWMKQFGILSQLFKPYEWMYRLLFWNKFCICASQIIYWLLYVF